MLEECECVECTIGLPIRQLSLHLLSTEQTTQHTTQLTTQHTTQQTTQHTKTTQNNSHSTPTEKAIQRQLHKHNQKTYEVFHKTLLKTDEWLKELCTTLEIDDLHLAYVILKAVLHTLRDRFPINECVHFSACLPLLLKGVYFDGWVPLDKPIKLKTANDFLDAIDRHQGLRPSVPEYITAKRIVHAVLTVLHKKSPGEEEKIRKILPHHIVELFEEPYPIGTPIA